MLNQVVDELLEGHPVSDVKLKEVLGHTPLQVRAQGCVGGGGAVRLWGRGSGRVRPALAWLPAARSAAACQRVCCLHAPSSPCQPPQVTAGAVLGVLFGIFFPVPQ